MPAHAIPADPDRLRLPVGGHSAITGKPFDATTDAGFLELCVRNDYGQHWRFERYDSDTKEAVFRREDGPDVASTP